MTRASKKYNLAITHPDLLKIWDFEKNLQLKPTEVTKGSEKLAWWKCPKNHSYEMAIKSKVHGQGCPFCSNRRLNKENNLAAQFPKLAKEWHPTKNGIIKPGDIFPSTKKKYWWKCNISDSHDYLASPASRLRKSVKSNNKTSGCPFCASKKSTSDYSLASLFPEIAKEWNFKKNSPEIPENILPYSSKKFWWTCPKGHVYEKAVIQRTSRGIGCSKCPKYHSLPEIRILAEFKSIFPSVESRIKLEGFEVDIFIPSENIAVEYDGLVWHQKVEKIKADDKKKNHFEKSSVSFFRLREAGLKKESKCDVITKSKQISKDDIDLLLKELKPICSNDVRQSIEAYLSKNEFVSEELFKKYVDYFPSPFPENSLKETHPNVAKDWDYEENFPLRPENYTYGSNIKVFWICPKKHREEKTIDQRVIYGCGYCGKNNKGAKKASPENNLRFLKPDLAIEWHPTKNGKLEPENVLPFSSRVVWWQCEKNPNHVWQAKVAVRSQGKEKCSICHKKITGAKPVTLTSIENNDEQIVFKSLNDAVKKLGVSKFRLKRLAIKNGILGKYTVAFKA